MIFILAYYHVMDFGIAVAARNVFLGSTYKNKALAEGLIIIFYKASLVFYSKTCFCFICKIIFLLIFD